MVHGVYRGRPIRNFVVDQSFNQLNDVRKVSSRRCQIVKELANPEIVAMPFVTESFKISLIVPVQEKDSQKVQSKSEI